MRIWVNRVLLGLGWCALAAAIAGVVLHFGSWRWRPFVLLASGASYLMAGSVVGLVVFLIARGWRSAGVAGVVLLAAVWTVAPIYIPNSHAASGPELTVLQSNLLFGGADSDAVVKLVRDNRVDVLTVEELLPEAVGKLTAAGLDDLLPYHYLQPASGGAAGTGIYTRYPLRDTKNYEGFIMHNVSATMDHPERGPIAVYAFHPVPPVVNFDAWRAEMSWIRDILDAEQGTAIVGADFNATRDHAAFRDLLRGRFAAADDQAGAGILRTYPADRAWGPVIGIDHVLLADATAEHVSTLTVPGSDHRAVLARIRLNE